MSDLAEPHDSELRSVAGLVLEAGIKQGLLSCVTD